LARVHSDVTATKEQLLARNEELEAEAERLRKDFDETEWALAEATSKWMHMEQVWVCLFEYHRRKACGEWG